MPRHEHFWGAEPWNRRSPFDREYRRLAYAEIERWLELHPNSDKSDIVVVEIVDASPQRSSRYWINAFVCDRSESAPRRTPHADVTTLDGREMDDVLRAADVLLTCDARVVGPSDCWVGAVFSRRGKAGWSTRCLPFPNILLADDEVPSAKNALRVLGRTALKYNDTVSFYLQPEE